MAQDWYYERDGKHCGPVPAKYLQQLASEGRLSPGDMVWRNGMANWIPASSLKGLFRAPQFEAEPESETPRHKACPMCGEQVLAVAKKCKYCGEQIVHGPRFSGARGDRAGTQKPADIADHRPIAGIAVACVFGTIAVLWNVAAIFRSLYTNPAGVEAALYRTFPALQDITLFSSSLGMLGNSVLLIGALLAFLCHPKGSLTVRLTSYSMLLVLFGMFTATIIAVTEASAWRTLDASTKGGILGGLIGGVLGGMFQWGLLLFLFRKRR